MAIKPICFMVMPFGKKPTNNTDPKTPGEINFDSLWDRALRPLIEELGYKPIRADQDVGSLIVQEMIERLAYSDLVITEMTILNANVYYEVGVRQASQRAGCVLIAANWARQAFDVDQMRRVSYPVVRQKSVCSAFSTTSSSCPTLVPVMQSADFGDFDHRSQIRRLLALGSSASFESAK